VTENNRYEFWNEDVTLQARHRIPDASVDLMVCDPPFGIDDPHGSYNRDESLVMDGYVEVPANEYKRFTHRWISEAERILRPGGSLVVISGYTNLHDILSALHHRTKLTEVNHLIWQFNFGVHTRRKFVSGHYHLLYWCKSPEKDRTFNQTCRFGEDERDTRGSVLYRDMQDVWQIKREYKPGQVKNKNALPDMLVEKIVQYCSSPGDLVADFFLGSFAVAKMAKALGRSCVGFELNKTAFDQGVKDVAATPVRPDSIAKRGRPSASLNRGERWGAAEIVGLAANFVTLRDTGRTKKAAVAELCSLYGRGRFGIERALRKSGVWGH
jgi:site-specific DNA-methyltransferase (adenine-specific)